MSKIRITWLGHASFKLEGNGKIIYLDPWIKKNPVCPISIDDTDDADIICVTHGHDDHLGDSIEIAKRTGATLVCNPEIGIYADKKGIKYDKGSCPLNIGGGAMIKGISINMVNAVHTSDILGEEFQKEGVVMPGSGACGYIIKMSQTVIYFAGDTGLFGDMALIGKLYAPRIAILPIGGKYNMGIFEASHAVSLINPKIVIPMHYDSFPNQKADTSKFKQMVKELSPTTEVKVLKPGEVYEEEL